MLPLCLMRWWRDFLECIKLPDLLRQDAARGQNAGFIHFPRQRGICLEHCLIAGLPASSVSVLRPLGNAVTMK